VDKVLFRKEIELDYYLLPLLFLRRFAAARESGDTEVGPEL
jgi:hypothetical protein